MTAILQKAVTLARSLWTKAKRRENPVEQRLERIEHHLENLDRRPTSTATTAQPTGNSMSWAAVAAKAARYQTAPIAQRPVVRVRMPEIAGKSNLDILTVVRTVI